MWVLSGLALSPVCCSGWQDLRGVLFPLRCVFRRLAIESSARTFSFDVSHSPVPTEAAPDTSRRRLYFSSILANTMLHPLPEVGGSARFSLTVQELTPQARGAGRRFDTHLRRETDNKSFSVARLGSAAEPRRGSDRGDAEFLFLLPLLVVLLVLLFFLLFSIIISGSNDVLCLVPPGLLRLPVAVYSPAGSVLLG